MRINNIYDIIACNRSLSNRDDKRIIAMIKQTPLLDNTKGYDERKIIGKVAEQLDTPFVSADLTQYTAKGLVGDNVTEILVDLLNKANGNIEKAQRGIVLLTDVDARYRFVNHDWEYTFLYRDLFSLIYNGQTEIEYKGRKINFDTRNVTFIGSGDMSECKEYLEFRKIHQRTFCWYNYFSELINIDELSVDRNTTKVRATNPKEYKKRRTNYTSQTILTK